MIEAGLVKWWGGKPQESLIYHSKRGTYLLTLIFELPAIRDASHPGGHDWREVSRKVSP
jgi:hypothetical protein